MPGSVLSVIWDDIRPFLASASSSGVSRRVTLPAPAGSLLRPILGSPSDCQDPTTFRAAFDFHIRRNGDTVHSLHRYIVKQGGRLNRATLALWRRGSRTPASEDSLRVLGLVEEKYGLPPGYFASKGGRSPRAISRKPIPGVSLNESRRWNEKAEGWEIYIPSVAFKNATSSFFGSRPFRMLLPDLAGLYEQLDAYLERHRAVLLGRFADPGTFFVKSVTARSRTAEYQSAPFYEAWRLAIQRYGIFNPYTGRGAIKALLPHGPHNVRDVLATHILKQTGSYEQASYAIQDTPDMVAQHYGRFLPQDKASLAAQVLNKVWA